MEKKRHQTVVSIKVTGTRIVYELIAAGPQSLKDPSPSVNAADDKESDLEVRGRLISMSGSMLFLMVVFGLNVKE